MSQDPLQPEAFLSKFGLSTFRPGQRDVVAAVLEGRDCMCIMPTGGGKSLCYQLPAIMRPGLTLVVSPLIALMKDQVDSLRQRGIRAEFVNSSLDAGTQRERLAGLGAGEYDLFYVAPERFRSRAFLDELHKHPISLLAVDEAHCISEWGHDFRHDYTRLGEYRQRLGNPQTIALTATATSDVRADIVLQLQMKEPATFVAGFARPNLRLEVVPVSSDSDKDQFVTGLVRNTRGCGIIYAATRKACDSLATYLKTVDRRSIAVYHGGLESDVRRKTQEAFMAGDVELVIATNAFGMGIDKSDVRFVVHYHYPGSVEAYYQEAGRAGRDGQPSRCVMLYLPSDARIQRFFIESAYPDPSVVQQVYEFLLAQEADPIELTQQELKEALKLSISSEGIGTCERLLEKCKVLERLEPNRNMGILRLNSDAPTLVDFLPRQATTQRQTLQQIESIIGDRRFEGVFFRPEALADRLETTLPTLTRTLRELTKLEAFDYVPPFRGRAIHIKRRDLPFQKLDLDFAALLTRKAADYAKLDEVVRLATTRRCRQRFVMEYFGDPDAANCGRCDQCDRGSNASSERQSYVERPSRIVPAQEPAVLQVVLKALSGVARARERVGKNLIAAMLVGSRAERVAKAGLQRLSTFGLMPGWSQVEAVQLLDAILAAGWLKQVELEPFRPILCLTESGRAVMTGESPAESPIDVTAGLLAKMRVALADAPTQGRNSCEVAAAEEVRLPTASTATFVPPASLNPSKKSVTETQTRIDRGQPPKEMNPDVASAPYWWSWRLLSDGYSVADCAAIRRLKSDEILRHAIAAHESGLVLQARWFFGSSELSALEQGAEPELGSARKSKGARGSGGGTHAWRPTPLQFELFNCLRAGHSSPRTRRPTAGTSLE